MNRQMTIPATDKANIAAPLENYPQVDPTPRSEGRKAQTSASRSIHLTVFEPKLFMGNIDNGVRGQAG